MRESLGIEFIYFSLDVALAVGYFFKLCLYKLVEAASNQ